MTDSTRPAVSPPPLTALALGAPLSLPSLGETWDQVLTATADSYAARATGDEAWADQAVASAAGAQLQAALFWSWCAAWDVSTSRTVFVVRPGADLDVSRWAPFVAELQAAHEADGLWAALAVLRRLQALQESDPDGFASLLLTLAASAWRGYDQRHGPFPGGPTGVAAHVLAWGRRADGRERFLTHHLQAGLRLTLLAEAAADMVGVEVDPAASHDIVRRLVCLVLGAIQDDMTGRLWRWPGQAGEFVRLAAAVVAAEYPWLRFTDHWIPANGTDPAMMMGGHGQEGPPRHDIPDGGEPVFHLDCALAEGEATPAQRGEHTLIRLARLVALDDGPGFEALLAETAGDPRLEARAASAAVDVLAAMARGAEEALMARP